MRTNDLRALIQRKLSTVEGATYYDIADKDAIFPHKVFRIEQIPLDSNRFDYRITIEIWDKSTVAVKVEDMADAIEDLFNNQNDPQETILPTFFVENRQLVPDENKMIRRRDITITCQNYENK